MDRPVRRLNFGCGPVLVDGWLGSDIIDYGQEHVGSITDGLPWPDGYFDGIVANHSLQALPSCELEGAVDELRRVLRRGGRLRAMVPDVIGAFRAYERSDFTWPGFVAIEEHWDLGRKYAHYLTWGGQNRTAFVPGTLVDLLERNGFAVLRLSYRWSVGERMPTYEPDDWEWLRDLDTRIDESIVVEVE